MASDDAAVRVRVASDLTAAIALEAGAGTGKTYTLVARAVALLEAGVPMRRLVLVTFLRAAAEELRVRLRRELSGREGAWAREALADLPAAAIGTLHSFAQRVLAQEAAAAGWDPAVRVVEEDEAEALDAHTFRLWLEGAAASRPEPLVALRRLGAAMGVRALADLARRLPADLPPDRPPEAPGPADAAAFRARLAAAADQFAALAADCRDPADRALADGPFLAAALDELDAWPEDERVAVIATSLHLPSPQAGNKKAWSPATSLEVLKNAWRDLRADQAELRAAAGEAATAELLAWLAPYPGHARQTRLAAGVATYDDLLVRAVTLLRTSPTARDRVRARYDALLVDEFQDTDPLQVALLDLVAGDPADARPGEAARLFVVGDPKQAIYRFRGADVDTYLSVRERFPAGGRLAITANHRSRPAILDAANVLCGRLMADGPISYRDLTAARPAAPEPAPPPLVLLRPGEADEPVETTSIEAVRAREARLVADHIAALLGGRVEGAGGVAPRAGDIALLFGARAAYPAYMAALAHAGVPYLAENDKGLWRATVPRDAARLLVAVATPRDRLAVAAALRTSLVGLSDADLWAFVRAGGRLDLTRRPPVGTPAAVERVVDALREAVLDRGTAPSVRLARLVERLDLAGAAALIDGEAGVRALSRVVETVRAREVMRVGPAALGELAQAFADVGYSPIDGAPGPDPAPSVDPAPPGGAVRLLTVHEAKGNEFPVVVLCDVWGGPRGGSERLVLGHDDGRPYVRVSAPAGPLWSPGAEARFAAETGQRAAERVRLLYVALTRARESLVVPAVSRPKNAVDGSFGRLLVRAAGGDDRSGDLVDALAGSGLPFAALTPARAPLPEAAPLDPAAFAAAAGEVDALRRRMAGYAGRTPIVRPSTAHTDAASRDPAAPAGAGRERARRQGLAVHAALATVLAPGRDAPDPDALERLARVEGEHLGLSPAEAGEAGAIAVRALAHPLLRRALAARHRAVEAAVSGRLASGGLVVGRVDLVFEEAGDWILVDLKTDRLAAPDADGARAHALRHRYDVQLALYAAVLGRTVGRAPGQRWLLFVRHDLAVDLGADPAADREEAT